MRNTVTALLSTYVIAVSLVATLAPAVRADLVAYREAIEDIQWALINSTEFLHRR